jgi:amidase
MVRKTSRRRVFAAGISVLCGLGSACAVRAAEFDVVGKSIAQLRDAQTQHQVTSLALVEAYLERIDELDRRGPALRSVIVTNPIARDQARALDAERAGGKLRGPLHGIPILVKDNIETADPMPTTAGSLALADNRTNRDAPAIARLRAAGVVILGKTNLSEWANIRSSSSVSGWSAIGGQTRNPYALNRNACGSSSGSGAAIAASLAAAAIGTETDGSITCPSSMNGLVGIKPTVGLVSRTYVIPISHRQDTPGPMTHTAADAKLLLAAMAGSDAADPATREADERKTKPAAIGTSAQGLRIGVSRIGAGPSAVKALLDAQIEALKRAGATLVEVELPSDTGKLNDMEMTLMLTELKSGMAQYLGALPKSDVRTLADLIAFNKAHAAEEMPLFAQELFERAETTKGLEDPEYRGALEQSRQIAGRDGLDKVLAAEKLVAIIAPTMGPAFPIDPINGDAFNTFGPGVFPAIVGYPHVTIPMGLVQGLPVGLSIIGPAWSDQDMLALAAIIEKLTGPIPAPTFVSSLDEPLLRGK